MTDPKIAEYLTMLETVTQEQLVGVGGPDLLRLLAVATPIFERFNGSTQTLAHVVLLGEILASMEDGVSSHEMGTGTLLTSEDRLTIIVAEIRTTLRLSRQLRASLPADSQSTRH